MISWADVELTESYTTDVELLTELIVKAIGLENEIDENSPFVYALTRLLALLRYKIKFFPEQVDIDNPDYLPLLQAEVGLGLPESDLFPAVELVRENKHWHGRKGNEALYEFIGDLIGSEIELYYPKRLIMCLDDLDTLLDGGESDNGPLPFKQSKMGRIRDGVLWASYTYIVHVLQGQNVTDLDFLHTVLRLIHPAGTQLFLQVTSISLGARSHVPEQVGLFNQDSLVTFFTYRDLPSLDNGLETDHLGSMTDTFLDLNFFAPIYIIDSRDESSANAFRVITDDGMLHKTIAGKPWAIFSRYKSSNQDEEEDYIKVYPDEDMNLLINQETNMSMSELLYDDIADLEYREIEHIAYDKANQNPPKYWYPDLAMCTIEDI